MEIKKFAVLVTFAAILMTVMVTTASPATVRIEVDLLAKATSYAPNGNFTHQQVTNDLDEDKCYWLNNTGLVVTKCTDPRPENAVVIVDVEYGGTPENYTVWADGTESDNSFCDLYVVDINGAKRQVPIGEENKITLCSNCAQNFSVYGYLVFKDLENAKKESCKILLETNP